jgi:uncharacterized protein YbjT (DUF2867 family)
MFVISGATGNTGSAAAKALLSAGKKVRAIVRDAKKGEGLAALGAELFVADLTDAAALERAASGAEGVYLLSPPDPVAQDFVRERKALTARQVAALARATVPHVVLLSSIGAQHASGTGPIETVHNAEQQLRESGLPATFVRASYFAENWGAVAHPVKQDGVLPSFIALDHKLPTVATADIGKLVADSLIEGARGVRALELAGPVDYSPNDVAEIFGKLLGKPVKAIAAPLEAVVPTFTSFGMSEHMAGLYRDMYAALAAGKLAPEAGNRVVRGSTPLIDVLRGVVG